MSIYDCFCRNRHSIKFRALTAVVLSSALPQLASADFEKDVEIALKFGQEDARYGQIKLDLNMRYENADVTGNALKTAEGFMARLRAGYLSPRFYGLQAYAEFEGNQDIGVNDYNTPRKGVMHNKGYDVILDPQDTELNQLWLSYSGIADTFVKVGRQRIKIDNDRFIGNVGWRQMEQTFDAVLLTNKFLPNTTVTAGYINGVQRVLSDFQKTTSPILNIAYDVKDIGKLTAYGYWLDYDEAENFASANQSYGIRFNGAAKVAENIKILYTTEYAHQSGYGNNPNNYDVDYYHVAGGISSFGITLKGGMEELGGDGAGKRFQTPLATLHPFNGWADVFLATPANGLRDIYGTAKVMIQGVELMGVYHEFTDDTGKLDYGNEYDFLISKKFGKHYSLLAKYAYYNADAYASDTQKFWIQGNISF